MLWYFCLHSKPTRALLGLYVHMYVHMYVHTCGTHMHTCVHVYVQTCVCIYVYSCICTFVCVHIFSVLDDQVNNTCGMLEHTRFVVLSCVYTILHY